MKIITPSGEYGYDHIETISLTSAELAQYAGRYYSSELDISWTLVAKDKHLVVQCRKYVDSKLTPVSRDIFNNDWKPLMSYSAKYLVVFQRDGHDAISGLRVSGIAVRNLNFIRQE